MEELTSIILNNGFAVAVSVFLLVKIDKSLVELRDAIAGLDKNIHLLSQKISE